jgi:hypothetical protein
MAAEIGIGDIPRVSPDTAYSLTGLGFLLTTGEYFCKIPVDLKGSFSQKGAER